MQTLKYKGETSMTKEDALKHLNDLRDQNHNRLIQLRELLKLLATNSKDLNLSVENIVKLIEIAIKDEEIFKGCSVSSMNVIPSESKNRRNFYFGKDRIEVEVEQEGEEIYVYNYTYDRG
jgi:hypothetical protein